MEQMFPLKKFITSLSFKQQTPEVDGVFRDDG